MDIGTMIGIGRSSLFEILVVAGPILLVAISIGLIISILQAITSIQEQTLTFVPKIIAIFVTLILLGPWMISQMISFTESLWRQIVNI